MRYLIIGLITSIFFTSAIWETDFDKAKKLASEQHKLILLNFSGSDWCGPCINLKKEIFDNHVFIEFANDSLILLNADFPRLKKHKLPPEQQSKNDQLADMYNKEGKFPLTLLLTAEGKVLKTWEGFPGGPVETFTNEIKQTMHAGN